MMHIFYRQHIVTTKKGTSVPVKAECYDHFSGQPTTTSPTLRSRIVSS